MSTQLRNNKSSFPGTMSLEMAGFPDIKEELKLPPKKRKFPTAQEARRICLKVAINNAKRNDAVIFDEEDYETYD
jgi:hypothetical protein